MYKQAEYTKNYRNEGMPRMKKTIKHIESNKCPLTFTVRQNIRLKMYT